MPNPEFILQEAIHITRRERELWDNVRQREHAARLQAEALQPTAA